MRARSCAAMVPGIVAALLLAPATASARNARAQFHVVVHVAPSVRVETRSETAGEAGKVAGVKLKLRVSGDLPQRVSVSGHSGIRITPAEGGFDVSIASADLPSKVHREPVKIYIEF